MEGQNADKQLHRGRETLRCGYTTGSCAAAAAKAAANMLFLHDPLLHVSLLTPKGIMLYLDVEKIQRTADSVRCAIQKDSGDDPDVTNGIYVFAEVSKSDTPGLHLEGGEGVGRVQKKGLWQNIGEPAINEVPQKMILQAVQQQCDEAGYTGGLDIVISAPEGVELASRTFNPRLGIQGGISILGTSGIVEPMSEKALTDTIYVEMKFLKENGHDWCYVVPGNYGSDFLTETLGYDGELSVKCSNYIGETIDDAAALKMKGILLVGHIGKLVKVAAGVMNTHSRQADCRLEVLACHAAMQGAKKEVVQSIMASITTAQALELLKEQSLLGAVMESVAERIYFHLKQRAGADLQIAAIVFSKEEGILCTTENTEELLRQIREETK